MENTIYHYSRGDMSTLLTPSLSSHSLGSGVSTTHYLGPTQVRLRLKSRRFGKTKGSKHLSRVQEPTHRTGGSSLVSLYESDIGIKGHSLVSRKDPDSSLDDKHKL